jgi:hypothetical protein
MPSTPHSKLDMTGFERVAPSVCKYTRCFVLGCKWIFYDHVKGFEHNVSRTWERLLGKSLRNPSAPRCYLYSEGDDLTCPKEIETQAAALVSQNTRVRTVNFATSGHVQHAKLDVDKYKLAILET